jgi:hypothetical protein
MNNDEDLEILDLDLVALRGTPSSRSPPSLRSTSSTSSLSRSFSSLSDLDADLPSRCLEACSSSESLASSYGGDELGLAEGTKWWEACEGERVGRAAGCGNEECMLLSPSP